jgi:hypothetical protein
MRTVSYGAVMASREAGVAISVGGAGLPRRLRLLAVTADFQRGGALLEKTKGGASGAPPRALWLV